MKPIYVKSLIAVLFLSNSLFSQNLLIEYTTKNNGSESIDNLIITDSVSIWNTTANTSSLEENPFLIKRHFLHTVYLREGLFNKLFYVRDSLHSMKWTLTSGSKNILNEQCHSAITNFRGRNYTAYYTTEIPNADGPWKFGGLPGLILMITSDDNMYTWTASKIIKETRPDNTIFPDIRKYKFIDWNNYVSKFIETINNWAKQSQSDGTIQPGTTVKVKIDAAEIIYPKAQQGEGLTIEQ